VSSVESGHRTRATRLLVVTAAIELGAGLTLLAVPAVVIRLLFGSAVDVLAAVGVARVTGVALIVFVRGDCDVTGWRVLS